jgi:hypothetical protein
MYTRRQPAAWAIALEEVRCWEDAAALMWLFEGAPTLAANVTPIDAIRMGVQFIGQRALASFLADHLNACDYGRWTYTHLLSSSRRRDADAQEIAALVARCAQRGVTLARREVEVPPPWRVVRAQIRSPLDEAALGALTRCDDLCANNRMPEPAELAGLVGGPATLEQVLDFVARCSAAGVELDWGADDVWWDVP